MFSYETAVHLLTCLDQVSRTETVPGQSFTNPFTEQIMEANYHPDRLVLFTLLISLLIAVSLVTAAALNRRQYRMWL